jgi:hypothetical protein
MNEPVVSDIEKRLNTSAATVITVAERLLNVFAGIPEFSEKARTGGYLSVTAKFADEVLLLSRIGTIAHADDANPKYQTKARKYVSCSLEKGRRLIFKAASLGHLSSWQSQDEANDQYAGAVWCDEFAVSFSGLPALADEAFCLVLSVHLGWMEPGRAYNIAQLSNNPYFESLMLAWHEAGNAGPVRIS